MHLKIEWWVVMVWHFGLSGSKFGEFILQILEEPSEIIIII